MRILCDKDQRKAALRTSGIDFRAAKPLFKGPTLTAPDGSEFITVGQLDGRVLVVRWAEEGKARRVLAIRKANAEEQARFEARFR